MLSDLVDTLPESSLVLETERLVLRPLCENDADIGLALFTDPRVVEYVCDLATPEEVVQRLPIETRRGAGGRLGIWVATCKETQTKVGTGVLLPLPVEIEDTDWSLLIEDTYPEAEIEVGYMLVPEAWGKGYATEICARLLRFGFTETALEEIKATTDPENTASQHVLKKCGMCDEGLRRAYATSCSGFGLTREAWQSNRKQK